MEIKTKYNIGDEVWVANIFREPIEVEVYGIVAEVKDSNVLIDYHVGLDKNGCALRKEELLFPTKEELLKSL
jgi:hypothetical protein